MHAAQVVKGMPENIHVMSNHELHLVVNLQDHVPSPPSPLEILLHSRSAQHTPRILLGHADLIRILSGDNKSFRPL